MAEIITKNPPQKEQAAKLKIGDVVQLKYSDYNPDHFYKICFINGGVGSLGFDGPFVDEGCTQRVATE